MTAPTKRDRLVKLVSKFQAKLDSGGGSLKGRTVLKRKIAECKKRIEEMER